MLGRFYPHKKPVGGQGMPAHCLLIYSYDIKPFAFLIIWKLLLL